MYEQLLKMTDLLMFGDGWELGIIAERVGMDARRVRLSHQLNSRFSIVLMDFISKICSHSLSSYSALFLFCYVGCNENAEDLLSISGL